MNMYAYINYNTANKMSLGEKSVKKHLHNIYLYISKIEFIFFNEVEKP